MNTARARAIVGVALASSLVGCPDDGEGGDTEAATEGTTTAASSSGGESSTTAVADSSSGGPPLDPKQMCGLPEGGPDSACSGDICFEHYPGAEVGCEVDADFCPSLPLGVVLTGICNRMGESTVYLFYYVDDDLPDEEIADRQSTSEGSCEATGGVWCPVWMPS